MVMHPDDPGILWERGLVCQSIRPGSSEEKQPVAVKRRNGLAAWVTDHDDLGVGPGRKDYHPWAKSWTENGP